MPNINKIKLSGTSYDIQDANATKTVELTQAQYDALVTGGTVDSNTFYVITDGEMFNPSGKVDTSAFTEFSGAVETELSGKTDESAFTAHTGDSTIHVTTAQTAAWNAKSDFSGSYNDLTDKPTIPTVPTSNTAFTNDAGYITEDAISGKADSSAVTEEISAAVSGKVDTSTFNTYSGSVETALSGKQDTLVSGTNIKTINNTSILGSGNIDIQGGGVDVVQTTGTSTTDVMSQDAVTTALNNKANNTAAFGGYKFGSSSGNDYLQYTNVKNDKIGSSIYYPKINGKGIFTNNSIFAQNNYNFQLVETSAITTSISSGSTDSEIPTAKAVYDAIPQGGGGSSYSAGTNIDITNDIISCTLNASNGAGDYSFKEGWATFAIGRCAHAEGEQTIASGPYSHVEGYFSTASTNYSHAEGYHTKANNQSEHASGQFNISSSASTTFGNSGNTLFSVGNGTDINARHNAFEIRQNGDIYLTLNGQDVKLQDQLGGGGSSVNVVQTTGTSTTDVMSQNAVTTQLSGYVTTDTLQDITAQKTFVGDPTNKKKSIKFKQYDNASKVGFVIVNSAETNNEVASFEFRPNTFTIDNVQHPLMYFGHYRNTNTANAGVPQTVIGFRQYDQLNAAAYHYLMPLPEKAKTPFNLTTSFKDYYAPMGFKNGSTMITADNTGVVDLSSELDGLKLKKLTQAEYDALATKDNSTLYVIVN